MAISTKPIPGTGFRIRIEDDNTATYINESGGEVARRTASGDIRLVNIETGSNASSIIDPKQFDEFLHSDDPVAARAELLKSVNSSIGILEGDGTILRNPNTNQEVARKNPSGSWQFVDAGGNLQGGEIPSDVFDQILKVDFQNTTQNTGDRDADGNQIIRDSDGNEIGKRNSSTGVLQIVDPSTGLPITGDVATSSLDVDTSGFVGQGGIEGSGIKDSSGTVPTKIVDDVFTDPATASDGGTDTATVPPTAAQQAPVSASPFGQAFSDELGGEKFADIFFDKDNQFSGIKDLLSGQLGSLAGRADELQINKGTLQALGGEFTGGQKELGDIRGQVNDLGNIFRGIGTGEADQRFDAFKQAQLEELDVQKGRAVGAQSEFLNRRGLENTSAGLNQQNRVGADFDRQAATLRAGLDLQQLGRQDQALLTESGLRGQEAGIVGQAAGLTGAKAGLTGQQAGLTQQQLGIEQLAQANIGLGLGAQAQEAGLFGAGLQNLLIPTNVDIAKTAAAAGGTVNTGGGGGNAFSGITSALGK